MMAWGEQSSIALAIRGADGSGGFSLRHSPRSYNLTSRSHRSSPRAIPASREGSPHRSPQAHPLSLPLNIPEVLSQKTRLPTWQAAALSPIAFY